MWIPRRISTKFGKAFSDSVEFSNKRPPSSIRQFRGWGARATLLYILLIGSFGLLAVRLFHLTIVRGQENRELSNENRIRTAIIHAPRGNLFDRRGVALTHNMPAFRVTKPCRENEACPTKFMTVAELEKSDISRQSVFLERDNLRDYLFPYEMGHVVGFLGEITAEELQNPYYAYQGYLGGDRLGRMGLEAELEKNLRGTDGRELIEMNAQHDKIRTLGKIDPVPGADITLSLDADLQKTAYEAMGENPGAIVVSRPKTGEILALVSTPGYDANMLNRGISGAEYQELVERDDKPMSNRATQEVYPPGSTFKMIVATAALESGVSPTMQIEDVGRVQIGDFSFSNWYFTQYGGTDGLVDMYKGIARSNDVYFYKLGEQVGVETIAKWARMFDVGVKTGIELPVEAEGVLADREWRKKVLHEEWYLGDTYHLAIGQGDLVTTVLQVNTWTNAVAGGGVLCRPTLLSQKSKVISQKLDNCQDLGIKKSTIDVITGGMRRACSSGDGVGYQGTGWPLFDFTVAREKLTGESGIGESRSVAVACKTGSAEFGDPNGKTHAWFTAFAPLPEKYPPDAKQPAITGDPEISVTVFVEKGGEGSTVAAPIAKKIFEAWFRR